MAPRSRKQQDEIWMFDKKVLKLSKQEIKVRAGSAFPPQYNPGLAVSCN